MDPVARIADIFSHETHNAKVTRASEVPTSYDSLTTEWLTDVMCRGVSGAKVEGFRFGERDDGSSNRRRIFLTYNDAGTKAGLPATVFCKCAETLQTRTVLGISGAAAGEANFFNKIRGRVAMEAPTAYYAGYDPNNHATILVLRDLAGEVKYCDSDTPFDWAMASGQMSNLARLHATFFKSPELGTASIPYRTWTQWWRDMMKASPNFAASCDQAFGQSEDLMAPRLFKRRAEVWPATTKSVDRHLELPQTLIHCDVHPRNWYRTNDGKMGLGDWQCMGVGHWARDVVYAMTTALTVENRRKWEKDLVRFYLDKMRELGAPQMSEEETWTNLRQQLFTALAFWTITLVPAPEMPDMQPVGPTREFLRRLYAAIDDHDALDSF